MKTFQKIFSVLAVLAMIVSLVPMSALAEETVTANVKASVSTKGTPPDPAEVYTIRMTADGEFPMPGGKTGGSADLQITGPGSGSFPAITYDTMGVYTYTIRQVPGTVEGAKYDSSVYNLKVSVYLENGKLALAFALRKQGEDKKLDACAFEVVYPVSVIDLTVKKVWDDAGDQDGLRPDSLTVTLTGDGKTVGTVTLNAGNNWTGTIQGLPEFVEDTRTPIEYVWSEPVADGYTSAKAEDGTTTTFTNTHEPETTERSVKKVWDDNDNKDKKRPATLKVTLKADGKEVTSVTLDEKSKWTATITDLPVNNAGKKITYTWTEETIKDYKLVDTKIEGTVTTLTNKEDTPPGPPPPPKDLGLGMMINVGDCLE